MKQAVTDEVSTGFVERWPGRARATERRDALGGRWLVAGVVGHQIRPRTYS